MEILPLVSVVIPTHNRPDFLRKTLQSIVQQTYQHLQIIVISNGPNVNNRNVARSISDPRLEYYEQENSGGPASPRNHGIRLAKGIYTAFCDDDDLWCKEKIQKQVDALEGKKDTGLCYTKMLRFDDKGEWSIAHESGGACFHSLLFRSVVPISSIFIRTSLLREYGGFSESYKVGDSEDYEFVLRYSLKTRFYFIDEFLIKYWSGGNRTTCLEFNKDIRVAFRHFKTIINIYYMIYKDSTTSWLTYVRPVLFNAKNTLKAIGYMIGKRFMKCR